MSMPIGTLLKLHSLNSWNTHKFDLRGVKSATLSLKRVSGVYSETCYIYDYEHNQIGSSTDFGLNWSYTTIAGTPPDLYPIVRTLSLYIPSSWTSDYDTSYIVCTLKSGVLYYRGAVSVSYSALSGHNLTYIDFEPNMYSPAIVSGSPTFATLVYDATTSLVTIVWNEYIISSYTWHTTTLSGQSWCIGGINHGGNISTVYYFLTDTGIYYFSSLSGGSITQYASAVPDSILADKGSCLFWEDYGNFYFLSDYFYQYNEATNTWKKTVLLGSCDHLAPIWSLKRIYGPSFYYYDLTVPYTIYNDKLVRISPQGGISQIPAYYLKDWASGIKSILETNYDKLIAFESGSDAGQVYISGPRAITDFGDIRECNIDHDEGKCTLEDTTSSSIWAVDDYLIFFNSDDTLIYQGFVINYSYKDRVRVVELESPWKRDFKEKVTGTFTNMLVEDIVSQVVEDNCYFLTTTYEIMTSTLETITFNQKTVEYVLRWASDKGNFNWRLTPQETLVLDDGTTSSEIFVRSSTGDNMSDVEYFYEPHRVSIVSLLGGFDQGSRVSASAVSSTLGYGRYFDTYPEETTTAGLQTVANNLLTSKNLELLQISFRIKGKGFISSGMQIDFEYLPYNLTNQTYWIESVQYNPIWDEMILQLTDALITEPPTGENQDGVNEVNNQQLIGETQSKVATVITDSGNIKLSSSGRLESNFIPLTTNMYDIGTTTEKIKTIHCVTLNCDTISVPGGSDADTLDGYHASSFVLGSSLGALTASSPLSLSGSAQIVGSAVSLSIPVASASANGYLSSTNWSTFNSKIANVVEDLSPQLGADLDTNGKNLSIPDNNASAFSIKEGTNKYQEFITTDSAEQIKFYKNTLFDTTIAIYFRDTAIAIQSITDGHLDLSADTSVDFNTPALDLSDQAKTILLKDNLSAALVFAESTNEYLKFDTTNSAEKIVSLKALEVPYEIYGSSWAASNQVPTKDAIYDEMETKLENIVEDTTPQLGGNLDTNYKTITAIRTSDTNNYLGTASSIGWKTSNTIDNISSFPYQTDRWVKPSDETASFLTYNSHIRTLYLTGRVLHFLFRYIPSTSNIEFSTWFYIDTRSGGDPWQEISFQTINYEYCTISHYEGNLTIRIMTAPYTFDDTTISISNGWHHIALKYVKSSSCSCYIDRVLQSEVTTSINENPFLIRVIDPYMYIDAPVVSTDADFVHIFQNYYPGNIISSGEIFTTDEAYSESWNGNISIPTKNAIYDQFHALDIVYDTTPQLGGNLDTNYKTITAIRTSDANNYIGTANSIPWKSDSIGSWEIYGATYQFSTYEGHIKCLDFNIGSGNGYVSLNNDTFEGSIWGYCGTDASRIYLQVSGIAYTYDISFHEHHLRITDYYLSTYIDLTPLSVGWHHFAFKFVKGSSLIIFIDKVIVYQPSSVANVNTFRFGIYDSDGAGNCFDAPVISTDTDFVDIFQNYLPATICSKGDVFTTDEAYNDTWNGDKSVPTKNAIYDKIEAVLADTTNITNITTALKDPTGFEDRSGSAFTLTDGTNKCTVEVTVVSGSYSIWFNGTEHVISTTKSIDCSDDEGTHAVYFDTDDTLKEIVNPTVANYYTLIVTKCLVTVFYWDATNNMSIRPSEERHGCAYGGMEHYLHHYETGLSHISGYGLSSFVIGDGSLDTHAQFAIAEGSVADEDIGISTSSISVGTGGDILYKTGATGLWKKTTQTGFWAKLATNRLYYNQYTSGAWQLTEVSQNGRFILMHHYLQSGKNDQMFAIMGQNEYSNLNDARNGAEVEISNLMTAGMVTPEFRPAYTIIYQTSSTYTNTIHARIVLVETGGDEYISWLNRPLTRGTAPLNYVSQSITDGVTSYSPSEDIIHDTLLDQGASFPTSPYDGALFWNTTDEAWYRYSEDAAAWVQMGAGGGTASQYFTNNAPLYWRNAADDAWLSTINVDDDNVLQIGTDVTSIQINLLDNKSNAFVIAEGSNNYVVISTTNSGEVIQFNKTVTLYSDICLTFRDWGNYIFSPSDGQFAIYCDGSLFYYAGIDHTFYCSDSDTLREVLRLADSVEDAVNYITITNSATTNYVGPKIQTTGSDDNIPLTIQAKGSAGIRLNSVTYVGDGSDTYYLRFMVDSSASYIDTYQSYLICRDQHSVNNLVLSHVSDSDSYLQITNGKSGSSSVIVESAGTANSLILKAGASTSLMTYVGYEACQYIDSTSITHYKNTWIWSSSDTDYQSANLILQRSRSSSPRKVRVGDIIGNVIFQSFVSDSASCPSAYIMSYCTGEMGTNDAPADLRFLTSPDGSATPLEVLRLNTSVASADSYIIITNGKISTSISTISTNDGDLSVSPADGHTLYLGSNNNEIQLGGNGTSEVTLYAGTAYNFSANNVPIRQLNAAGTSYLEIIKIDADNILQIAKDISYSKYNHAIEFLDYTVFDNVLYQANGYAHKWKNNAGTLWLDMVHTNASDALVLGTDAGYIDLVKRSYHRDALTLYNNKALKAYNYAENAELDLIKLDTSNILQIGSGSVSITLNKTTTTPEVIVSNSQQYKHSRVLSQSFETTGNATISTETKDSHLTTTKIAITSDYGYAKQNVGEYSSTTTLQYWSCWFATDGSSNYGIDIRDGSNNVVVALNPNGNTLYYTINYSTFYEIGKIVANKMYHVRIAWLKGLVAIIYINDVYVATYTAGNYNSYDLFVNCSTSTKYCWIDAIYVGTSEKDARKSLKTAPLDAESIFSNYLDSDEVHIKQITITNPQQYKHTNCLPIEDNIGTSNSITTENYQGHLTARKGTWGTAWNEISVLVSPGDNFYYSAWVYYDTTKTNAHFINFHQSWTSAFYIIIEGDSGIGIYDTSAHYYYKPSGSGWVFVSVYYVKTITTAYFFINNQYINKSEICNSVTIDRISHQADTTTSYYWDAEYCGSSEKIARLAYKTAPINAESLFSDYTNTDQLVAKTAKIGETGNYKGTHCVQTGTSGTPSNVSETMGTSNSGQVISSWQGHNYPIEITRGATGSQAANYYKDQTATSYTFISAWIGIDDINKSCLIEGNDGTRYVDFGIWEGSIRYTLNGASLVVVCPAVVNTWYHLVMYWDDVNDKVSMWVDDGFIGSFAVASITGLTRAYIAAGYSYTSFKAYFDAFYIGLDGILARLSLSDKQTYDDRWTPYGLKGWHYLSNPVDVASLMNTETSGEHTTSAFSSFVPPNATRILLWVRWQVSEANGVLSFKQNSVIHHNIVNVGAYDYASIDKDIPLDSSLQFVYAFDATYTFNVKYFYLRGYLL